MSRLTLPVEKRDHIRGNPDAPVTLLEYGDYECPYCGQAYGIVKMVEAQAGDLLRFVFRNFPLTQIHPHAFPAACAAEAAGLQGRFWAMHDTLFENQDRLEDEDLIDYAQALDLDARRFVQDMRSEAVERRIREDFMSGVRSGVNGTPTFFINGRRHDGSWDYPSLVQAIQYAARELAHG